MDEKTILEMSLMVRECRVLQHKLKKVLEESYFHNTRCSFSRRAECRMVIERLINSVEVLADVLQLPPYDAKHSLVMNFVGQARRRSGAKLRTPDGHSG